MRKTFSLVAVLAALGLPGPAPAQSSPAFRPGEVPAQVENGGYRYFRVATAADPLNLRAGRTAAAEIVARLAPGTLLVNLGCMADSGRTWCDVQPVGGGARGYVDASFLAPVRSPGGGYAKGPDDSALRAGTGDFDATGSVPCTLGGTPGRCPFGVARAGGGDATVVVTKPDGRTRAIFFSLGRAIGADTSQADPGDFSATRKGDSTVVTIGSERYDLPDAIVLGG